MKLNIYVEGGAKKQKDLNISCRRGFKAFVEKAGIPGEKVQFIPRFGRENVFTVFRKAVPSDPKCLLLIDSEVPIRAAHACKVDGSGGLPWEHLKLREGDKHWQKPTQADSTHCHFMVECMENWFLADRDTLQKYFRDNFQTSQLPGAAQVETVSKLAVLDALKKATKDCSRGCYDKGPHSFEILELVHPDRVCKVSPWAKRFIETVKQRISA